VAWLMNVATLRQIEFFVEKANDRLKLMHGSTNERR
jgi:hypothetical protein